MLGQFCLFQLLIRDWLQNWNFKFIILQYKVYQVPILMSKKFWEQYGYNSFMSLETFTFQQHDFQKLIVLQIILQYYLHLIRTVLTFKLLSAMIPNSIANNPYMDEPSINLNQNPIGSSSSAHYRSYNQTYPAPQPGITTIPEDNTQHLYSHSKSNFNPYPQIQMNSKINHLSSQLNVIENENYQLKKQMDLYIITIQKLKQLNADQQGVINGLQNYREETGGYSQALNQRNLELNNQIQNLLLERQMLSNKITSEQMMRGRELQSLAYRLAERDNQNFQLKKRLNAVSEVKMRLESDIASLKFSYENIKNKAELELREKAFRLQQNQKTLQDCLRNKDQQIKYLIDKVRGLQDQLKKQRESETLLLTKIADQSRMYPEGSSIKSAGKQNNRDRQNQSNRLVVLLEEKDRRLGQKDKEIDNLYNKMKNLQLKIQASEAANQAMSKLHEKRLKQETDKVPDSGAPHMLKTVKRIRMGIVDMVFEVYVNSIDTADKKKSNSLVLFMTNISQFLSRQGRQLKISIQAYEDTKKSIQHHLNTKALSQEIKQQLSSSIGKFSAEQSKPRDKMNKWIEGTIVYTVEQKRIDKSDKNKEMLFLFRLLTIKYRIVYPIKGEQIRVDEDLQSILQNKIVGAVKHFVLNRGTE